MAKPREFWVVMNGDVPMFVDRTKVGAVAWLKLEEPGCELVHVREVTKPKRKGKR